MSSLSANSCYLPNDPRCSFHASSPSHLQDYLTPLHVAAHCGNVRVAKLLLDRKCEVNPRARVSLSLQGLRAAYVCIASKMDFVSGSVLCIEELMCVNVCVFTTLLICQSLSKFAVNFS